jgi:hypothetical protein
MPELQPFQDDTLDIVFQDAVRSNLAGADAARGRLAFLGAEPGRGEVSWREIALESTIPTYASLAAQKPLGNRLVRSVGLTRSSSEKASALSTVLRSLRQRFLDSLPEPLFIRFLELLNYPQIIYEASRKILMYTAGQITRAAALVETGLHFLGSERETALRLRNGGLFPDELEAVSVLSLGMLNPPVEPAWLRDLRLAAGSIKGKFLRQPDLPLSDEVRCLVRHGPFRMQVITEWRGGALFYSHWSADVDTVLVAHQDGLPPGSDLAEMLRQHAVSVQREGELRIAWMRISSKVIYLIATYLIFGPAGLITLGLRLLLEGVLRVSAGGRLCLPSATAASQA